MEQQLCVFACSALGEMGALILALAAFVYGAWQRHGKVKTAAKVEALAQDKVQLQAEIKSLSLRPPALPTVPLVITPQGTLAIASLPPPSSSLEQPPFAPAQRTPAPPADHDDETDTTLD